MWKIFQHNKGGERGGSIALLYRPGAAARLDGNDSTIRGHMQCGTNIDSLSCKGAETELLADEMSMYLQQPYSGWLYRPVFDFEDFLLHVLLIPCVNNKQTNWQTGKLANWQIGKLANWQTGQLANNRISTKYSSYS